MRTTNLVLIFFRAKNKFIPTSVEELIKQESEKGKSFVPKAQSSAGNQAISTSTTTFVISHDSPPRPESENKSAADKVEVSPTSEPPEKISVTGDDEDDTPALLGLKVYTKIQALAVVTGHIRTS